MSFGGKKADSLGLKDPEVPSRPSAAPPPCPRCELIKSQCTKTVINYQKSHRKKMEALRSELKSARQQTDILQRQLRGYRTTGRVIPAIAVLAAAGWLLVRRLRQPKNSPAEEATSTPEQQPAAVEAVVNSTASIDQKAVI